MYLDEILHGNYAIGVYHKIVLSISTIGNTNMVDKQTFEVGLTLVLLTVVLTMVCGCSFFCKIQNSG
jgi:hypothetical protein